MDRNNDPKTVTIHVSMFDKLMEMADVAVHESGTFQNDVKRIKRHSERFNPHLREARLAQEAETKKVRARLRQLFKAGGKLIYYREGKDLYWPVKLTKRMKYDWTMLGMVSATEHRKFSRYEHWQSLHNFVIDGEVPLCDNPMRRGAAMRALTQAEREAQWEVNNPFKVDRPYNIKVVIKGDSLTVHKEDLVGAYFPANEQNEAKLYLSKIKALMHDIIGDGFVQELHRIAHEVFKIGGDKYFKELIVERNW